MLSQSGFAATKSQHRLETVSLSQALAQTPVRTSTGLNHLDHVLGGGIACHQITEIYGCPGSGKTWFGMQVAAQTIARGQAVTWLECSQALPASRLRDFLHAVNVNLDNLPDTVRADQSGADSVHQHGEDDGNGEEEREDRVERQLGMVQCIATPTMTSLLALLLTHGPDAEDKSLIKDETSLLVIDDLTTLYNAAFPPDATHKETSLKKAKVLSTLADLLTRLAAKRGIAVLVLSKLTSRIVRGAPAQLESPFGDAWSARCSVRIVLYRDDPPRRVTLTQDGEDVRWLAVQKTSGRNVLDPPGLPFKIIGSGLVTVDLEVSQTTQSRSQTPKLATSQVQVQGSSSLSRVRSNSATPESESAAKRVRLEEAAGQHDDDGEDEFGSDPEEDHVGQS